MNKIFPSKLKIKRIVSSIIDDFLIFFKHNSMCFKSESDIKCYLYHQLISKIPNQIKSGNFEKTEKKYTEFLITTEFGTEKKYKKIETGKRYARKYDIVILDPDLIEKEHKAFIAIEIKFNPNKSLITHGDCGKDLRKLNLARNKLEAGYLLILGNSKLSGNRINKYKKFDKYFEKSKILERGEMDLYLHIYHRDYITGKVHSNHK